MAVGWEEYAVFGTVLLISAAIGVFYTVFQKQNSTKEYLLANRNMHYFPVALSMACSAISAITMISYPVEIYNYGTQYTFLLISFVLFNLSLAYLYIPVYFQLGVSSAYEYIELRFNSKLRRIISTLALLHLSMTMSIAIYSAALAINHVTDVNTRILTLIMYAVCIFYSSLGGLKAVLITDAFQSFIMLISLIIIVGIGIDNVGGFSIIWERAERGNRIEFLNFDTDLRVRHTVWTSIIGGYFFMIPNFAAAQIQVQRFLSLPNVNSARKAVLINFIGLFLIVILSFFLGLVIYATYHKCDPIFSGIVENSDQLVPHFAAETVIGKPGLLGLYIAGMTAASLSTLSSGLTALSSIVTFDFVMKIYPDLSDTKLTYISKISCFLLGIFSYLFVFVIENMGNILPITSSFFGIILGPTFGLYTLGMFFPWANYRGSLLGLLLSFLIMLLFVLGTNLNSIKDKFPNQKLSFPDTEEECLVEGNSKFFNYIEVNSTNFNSNSKEHIFSSWKEDDDSSSFIKLMSISYMYYTAMSSILSVILGGIFSLLFRKFSKQEKYEKIKRNTLSVPLFKMWKKFFPKQMNNVIEEEEEDTENKDVEEKDINNTKKLEKEIDCNSNYD